MQGEADRSLLPWALQTLQPRGRQVSWGARGQAEGCVLQSSGALAMASQWPAPGLEAAVSLSPIPPSLPLPPNGGACLCGSQSVEASATGVYGHRH